MNTKQLIRDALNLPTTAIAYHISQLLTTFYPEKGRIESNDCAFNLESYAHANLCSLQLNGSIHNQLTTYWNSSVNAPYPMIENAWVEVIWHDQKLEVLQMNWAASMGQVRYYWIMADTMAIAQSFFAAVCEWNTEIRDEVLVFEEGTWVKNSELFHAIQGSSFDTLILQGTLKQEIQSDLENFFNSHAIYQDYNIPWKRGILFIGPPGNGKTHTVKALINSLKRPCLYVKSFRSHFNTESESIRRVFHRARESAPCILVLEDLDSLLNRENRSFFLNELDGFAINEGILTIATTNYPERLDPAILDRPSRFDRKYHFELPEILERSAYIQSWNSKLKSAMQLSETGIQQVAENTIGFSFAYLKELFLSSTMAWVQTMTSGSMDQVMRSQAKTLHEQMQSAPVESELTGADRSDASATEMATIMQTIAWVDHYQDHH
ncbi:MAG: ATP-binding protein [Cyanobacteria bacterium RU_5_0]|nr:ATP-binding protein [Cyanobacteria bacterium RU_5_0]